MDKFRTKEVIIYGFAATTIGMLAVGAELIRRQIKGIAAFQYSNDMTEAQIERIMDQTDRSADLSTTLFSVRPEISEEWDAFDQIIQQAKKSGQQR